MRDQGLVDVVELDEQTDSRSRRDPKIRAAREAAPGPVLAFGLWLLQPQAIRSLRTAGYRLVGTLDDDYWDIPDWQPSGEATAAAVAAIEAALAELDEVVVTTPALAAAVARHAALRAPARIIPTALPVARLPLAQPNTGKAVRIGWAGTATHGGDWDAVRPAIEALLRDYAHVRLALLTKNPPRWLAAHPQVEIHRPVDFERYYTTLSTLRLDLAVAPLVAHPFNESKSNLKALDFAALGLPLVASRVGPYADLPHGETCFTIPDNDPAQWVEALASLIGDAEQRRAMGAAARRWVADTYSLDVTGPQWAEVLGVAGRGAPAGVDSVNGPSIPARTLYIDNLAPDTPDEELSALFARFGPVWKIARRRGHAFVHYDRTASVDLPSVISAAKGARLRGKVIRVALARDRWAEP
jgi:hypothetical protein